MLHIHTAVNDAGELWAKVNEGEMTRVLSDAQGYRPLISPDGKWLAVEVRLMSNVNVVRLFRRDGLQFIAASEDVTATAWKQATASKGIKLDTLEQTRAHVSSWGSEGKFLRLELSAQVPGNKNVFAAIVAVPLINQP